MKKTYCIICILLSFLTSLSSQEKHASFSERIKEREQLVNKEVKNYPGIRISDKQVLDAMATVPRHAFVPEEMQSYAYLNRPLPIGYDQTISQPVIVASMTQLLEVEAGMRILEIGTGSGYQAAILAELGAEVYSIEIIKELGIKAERTLKELGYSSVRVKVGDGYEGWPEFAPFDRIIVTCAPENVPEPLKEQVKAGGWIVIPVGAENEVQYLAVLKKSMKGSLKMDVKYPVRFVPMTGKARNKREQ